MLDAARSVAVSIRWEWFRLSHRRAFQVIMGMIAVAVILILVGAVLIPKASDEFDLTPGAFPLLIFLALNVVGPFLAVFLTAIVFSGEFGWGTLRALLARGRPRWQVALAKLLLVGGVLAVVWIVSWGVAAVVGLIAGNAEASLLLPFRDAPEGWRAIAVRFFSSLPAAIAYMGLTALLCVVSRSATFGVIVAAAILIAESTTYPVAILITSEIYDFPLHQYLRWTLRGATSGLAGNDDINPWHFAPAALAYITLFCTLTLAVLTRRDLGSGNG